MRRPDVPPNTAPVAETVPEADGIPRSGLSLARIVIVLYIAGLVAAWIAGAGSDSSQTDPVSPRARPGAEDGVVSG